MRLVRLIVLVHIDQTTVITRKSYCLQIQSIRARLTTYRVQESVCTEHLATVEENLYLLFRCLTAVANTATLSKDILVSPTRKRLRDYLDFFDSLAKQETRPIALHFVHEITDDFAVAE